MDESDRPKRVGDASAISPVLRGSLISLTRYSTKRSSLSPLSALFPKVTTTESLIGLGPKIQTRLETIGGSEEAAGEKSPEESMLRQVLQWLTQGEEGE